MRRSGAVLFLAVFLAATGCGGGAISNARQAYQDGRYLEAAEKLDAYEHEVHKLSPEKQADYGLYRGLSLMMLGDHAEAGRWLDFTAAIEAKRPGTLGPEKQRELGQARATLAKNQGDDSRSAPAMQLRTSTSP